MKQGLEKKRWSDEVFSFLTQRIPDRPGLACFDFDNTLIHNDFGERLMEAIVKEGMPFLPKDLSHYFQDTAFWKDHHTKPLAEKEVRLWEEYSHRLKEDGVESAYRWTSFLFQGFSISEFNSFSRVKWNEVSRKKDALAVFPQPEMLDLIAFLQMYNWEIYVVTASPELGIRAIISFFGLEESKVLGMKQTLDENQKTTAEIIEPYTYGDGKVKAIQHFIGKTPDLAFGDSMNDYPMLCYAKKGIGIDKGSLEFRTACQKSGLLLQPFFEA
ncbi:HAD phosphoserine phosphatase-like hydrolase, family IB [Leptospira ryugenii]|uniref:HAD phosphoserine phosphatase-like hydrolase, family IB n=1 Tax=Leptospira ryugenii TaxID=1917863 RepID=A0A2P2DVE5_9LEPT|nr:haloacid dehalogenase-like hydrolase [Leptospira ryugenii]GBF48573.1 HAD phosphoserine phosphatase-like hydrolase, family IB [Leptospira ryugenii]